MKPWIDYRLEDDHLLYDQEFDLEAELASSVAFVEESLHCPAPGHSPSLERSGTETSPSVHNTSGGYGQILDLQRELLLVKAALQREVSKNEALEQNLQAQKQLTEKETKKLKEATIVLENNEKYIRKQVATIRDLGNKLDEQVHKNETLQQSVFTFQKKTKDLSLQLKQANQLLQNKEDQLVKKICSYKVQGDEVKNLEDKNQMLEEKLKVQEKKAKEKSLMLDQATEQALKNERYIEKKVREVTALQSRLRTLEEEKEALRSQMHRGQRSQTQAGSSSETNRVTSQNPNMGERGPTWRAEPPPRPYGRLSRH